MDTFLKQALTFLTSKDAETNLVWGIGLGEGNGSDISELMDLLINIGVKCQFPKEVNSKQIIIRKHKSIFRICCKGINSEGNYKCKVGFISGQTMMNILFSLEQKDVPFYDVWNNKYYP